MLSILLLMLDTEEEKSTVTDIYNKHHDKMLAIAMNILHNEYDAEDALSNAFYTIANNAKSFKKYSKGQIKKYAYTTVKFKSYEILKNTPYYEPLDEDKIGEIDENLKNASEGNAYISAVLKLPQTYITTLILHFTYGFNADEIAEIMSLTPRSVTSRITRAKKMLEASLKEENLW